MLEIFVNYSGRLFYIGLILSFLIFIPVIIGIIINIIIIKKLPKILLENGYNKLSEDIKNVKLIMANNPKSKKWQKAQLTFQEFRHLNTAKENINLKNYQNINKMFFIISFIFLIFLLIAGWGMGFSLFGAFMTSIIKNENIKIILVMALFAVVTIFVCIILTKFIFIYKKYY
jgi:ABC-type multidrug transport system fused ATPase/permease subunit